MNLVWGFLITAAVTAIAVAAMLFVRRGAPVGSRFTDGDRASGVFGVLATGFSVLLGFIVFLAFTSYDQSRTGAETEALMVIQQVETAQFFADETALELTGELVCYGRSVVSDEWEALRSGTLGDRINPWGVELFRTVRTIEPTTAAEQSAYDKWLEQTSTREGARLDRVHGAVGVIPTQLWIVLFFIASVIFVYMLFFADRGEGAATQAVLMGSVVSVIVTLFLLLYALDKPFGSGVGGLEPVAMERVTSSRRRGTLGRRRAGSDPVRLRGRAGGSVSAGSPSAEGRLDILATVLLALATVATAWSGYQASRWNGEQAKAFSRASALRIESAKTADLANSQTQIDVATFIQWVDAYALEEEELVDFYLERFRAEFKPAVNAWIATRPLQPRRAADSVRHAGVPGRGTGGGRADRGRSGGLVGDGEDERPARHELRPRRRAVRRRALLRRHERELGTLRLRRIMLAFGIVIFVATVIWIATFPVSISV